MKEVKIGLIGFGTIGTGMVKTIFQNREWIKNRTGIDLNLVKIADIDIKREREVKVSEDLLTTDAYEIINDPSIDIVVELVGGTTVAKQFIIDSIRNGKAVVTANKALLAEHGEEIFRLSREKGIPIAFEASVGGGIPIIKAMRESYAANHISRIAGIVNGTCNYILTTMEKEGKDFREVLAEAQKNGYAEADPSLDIDGGDSAHKLAILAMLAFGKRVNLKEIYVEGISRITPLDIKFASDLHYRIKLLAIAREREDGVELRVHPAMVPEEHLLAKIDGVYNAIYLEGDIVGPNLLYGQGAGMMATASAVVADIIDLARKIDYPRVEEDFVKCDGDLNIIPIEKHVSPFYLRFQVVDKPGVLAKIAGILGDHDISIASMIQPERREGESVPIVIITHESVEGNLIKAIEKIDKLDIIRAKPRS